MKLVHYNMSWVSTVATDGLLLKHQANSSHSADPPTPSLPHNRAFPAVDG